MLQICLLSFVLFCACVCWFVLVVFISYFLSNYVVWICVMYPFVILYYSSLSQWCSIYIYSFPLFVQSVLLVINFVFVWLNEALWALPCNKTNSAIFTATSKTVPAVTPFARKSQPEIYTELYPKATCTIHTNNPRKDILSYTYLYIPPRQIKFTCYAYNASQNIHQ